MTQNKSNINQFIDNIKTLKHTIKAISEFDQNTSIKVLESHEQLLDTCWQNCSAGRFEVGSDIPFDSNVFWWQTNGALHYKEACANMTDLLIIVKVIHLTKTHKFHVFHRVTYQIFQFNESTSSSVLEISVELLELYWLQFVEAYLKIIKENIVPVLVANVYVETESYYVNAKVKCKILLLNQSQLFSMAQVLHEPQVLQEPQVAEKHDEPNSDYIVESIVESVVESAVESVVVSVDQVVLSNDKSDDTITDRLHENTEADLITHCKEELDEPQTTHVNHNNSVFATIPNFWSMFNNWFGFIWRKSDSRNKDREGTKIFNCFDFFSNRSSD